MLDATAAYARGAVELAVGDARAAVVALRRAAQNWQQLEAPYEAARARALVGAACRALGDDDAAAFELEAARGVFAGLHATPELARVEALIGPDPPEETGGLTPRELQVLRLVATGKSNREIAAGPRRERAHGRPARPEHLRQARCLVAHRRERVRVRPSPGVTRPRGQK